MYEITMTGNPMVSACNDSTWGVQDASAFAPAFGSREVGFFSREKEEKFMEKWSQNKKTIFQEMCADFSRQKRIITVWL
jgi:hypothetical protein